MDWYLTAMRKYATFSGRARRKEYWMFCLFNFLFGIAAMILDRVLGIAVTGLGYGAIYGLYMLATLIPCLSVSFRRLHDTGRSGWSLLLVLIPLIGSIWLIVLLCSDGDEAANKYGLNPKLA